ncbi:uncharacterized protein B0H18DRAFT_35439 [Fomitopsis serialis]|uniref:uncharacterized protein n=1 Tax=Fomitopsis serialis TaxID=139415 RepID=UPI0020083765|nr:uncharacterized protein B0H18DRAFT_35439 [Neoantrodia serialis]KAH9917501.1 hypothetical protein B0H18DRAFT_35439 [Neoantrodia serialis]
MFCLHIVKTKLPSHTRVDIKGKTMNSPGMQRSTPHKNNANVDDIVDVLEELQQVRSSGCAKVLLQFSFKAILHRITQRFEALGKRCASGATLCYPRLLRICCICATRGQFPMVSLVFGPTDRRALGSVTHFNHLIDLEAEYAKLGRTLADGYEQLLEKVRTFARTGADGGRSRPRSMIQRMPVDLAAVPACFRPSN